MLKRMQLQLKNKKYMRVHIAVGVLLCVVIVLIALRIYAAIVLRNTTMANADPVVRVIKAPQGGGEEKIVLPGTVQAWHEATIYARTNGYVKNWYVDIGSHVKAGDLLAEIETPELDAQCRQAAADLNTVKANYKLAQITARRWVNLLRTDSVSKQETDEKVNMEKAIAAEVIAAKLILTAYVN